MRSVVPLAAVVLAAAGCPLTLSEHAPAASPDPAVVSLYPVPHARGVMVTSGGWAYCQQVRALARKGRYTLLCGRYAKDGYLGPGLRSQRHLDWGDPDYLASLAAKVEALRRRVGGDLVLIGVSYSGFGVATLASHHPELHPQRLIVIDSYLDLVARRAAARTSNGTAHEIDDETGGTPAALEARSVDVDGLARLVETGTDLTVIWSVAPEERREFNGATCDRNANAGVLQRLANVVRRPVTAWVTLNRHGHDLWDHGDSIMSGRAPGQRVLFRPGGPIPSGAVCR
jgi:pimeloyl-ACP methyl ester carboxylesterase